MRFRRFGRYVVNLDAAPSKPTTSIEFTGEEAKALRAYIESLSQATWPPSRPSPPDADAGRWAATRKRRERTP